MHANRHKITLFPQNSYPEFMHSCIFGQNLTTSLLSRLISTEHFHKAVTVNDATYDIVLWGVEDRAFSSPRLYSSYISEKDYIILLPDMHNTETAFLWLERHFKTLAGLYSTYCSDTKYSFRRTGRRRHYLYC